MRKTRYLSVSQAAKKIGISRIAVYKRIKSGKIKAERIGRMIVIPERSLDRRQLSGSMKKRINRAVRKTFAEYGEVIKRLGRE
jgi:excisionase family DNA binding protein